MDRHIITLREDREGDKVWREVESNPGQHVRLSEWRSNVCSALTKQTAKSTCGPIGFFNGLALSLRESKWAKRQQRLWTIPS